MDGLDWVNWLDGLNWVNWLDGFNWVNWVNYHLCVEEDRFRAPE